MDLLQADPISVPTSTSSLFPKGVVNFSSSSGEDGSDDMMEGFGNFTDFTSKKYRVTVLKHPR
jgi:hypothetical protein